MKWDRIFSRMPPPGDHVRFTPESGHVQCVRKVPIADTQEFGSHQKKNPGTLPGVSSASRRWPISKGGGSRAALVSPVFRLIEQPYGITARITPASSKPATDAVVKMISEIKVTILSPKVTFPSPLIV